MAAHNPNSPKIVLSQPQILEGVFPARTCSDQILTTTQRLQRIA
jgi:hypothetical protein